MEGEEGSSGPRLSKRFNDGKPGSGEVDYKTKSGTAWSHSFLNQKPWHPLSYPNQRRKWIAEQSHAHHERRADEVAREYAQEQEFFRQTALVSSKEKEKMEMMQAVSFMYLRPPGYNAESAKAAEVSDEKRKEEQENPTTLSREPAVQGPSSSTPTKNKPRPKDVFGRFLPTEEEFGALKGAPRMETGAPARVKPFAIEIRNVKCVRCGTFGHQSGDRECPLKDAIMANEESRLKRDDPLTIMMANMDPTEPLKWELKQKPGLSPPRGGFDPDDPNQQIVAEDIFDEYGGFLGNDNVPELLTKFSSGKLEKKSKPRKRRRDLSPSRESRRHVESDYHSHSDHEKRRSRREKKKKKLKDQNQTLSGFDSSESDGHYYRRRRSRHSSPSVENDDYHSYSDHEKRSSRMKKRKKKQKDQNQTHSGFDTSESDEQYRRRKSRHSSPSVGSDDCHSHSDHEKRSLRREKKKKKQKDQAQTHSGFYSSESDGHYRRRRSRHSSPSVENDGCHSHSDREKSSRREKKKKKQKDQNQPHSDFDSSESDGRHRRRRSRHSSPPADKNSDKKHGRKKSKHSKYPVEELGFERPYSRHNRQNQKYQKTRI